MEAKENPYRKYPGGNFPRDVHINCSNCATAHDDGFKVGRDSFLDDVGNATIPLSEAYKEGMKKVVEFIRAERKCRYIDDVLYYPVYEKALEAKEEEWGINAD